MNYGDGVCGSKKEVSSVENKNYKKGIFFIIASAFFFALMNLFIRLTGDVPTLQKCFFRNFFAMIIALATLIKTKTPIKIGKGNTKYLLGRSISGGLGMICNFYAVDRMSISDAAILNKLSPFFAIIFSYIVLKETANKHEWTAVIIAFIGALFVIKPSFNFEGLPAFLGFLGGLGAGLAYTFVRKLGMRNENSMIIVAFFSCFTSLLLLPNLIFNFVPMTAREWFFLCLTGMSAALGQICITNAYSNAPAKEISVYDFSIVIFTAMFGFFFLDQIPDYLSFIGYFIIIGTAIVKWYYTVILPKKKQSVS